jgi:CHAD domain-containing protein
VLAKSATAIQRRLHRGLSDAALLEAFRREYRRTRRLTRKARRKPGKDAWHRWRKQVKALHYQAASLAEIRPPKLRRLAGRCWRLQGLLGKHHDLYITRERLARLRIDPINEPCRTRSLHAIDQGIARLEAKVRRLTGSFLRQTSREFVVRLRQPDDD